VSLPFGGNARKIPHLEGEDFVVAVVDSGELTGLFNSYRRKAIKDELSAQVCEYLISIGRAEYFVGGYRRLIGGRTEPARIENAGYL